MPTALMAEDEPLLAQALQAELARAWPELQVLRTVGDGATAVQAALELLPQVLLFDIRMPGLGGLDAALELADLWPPAHAPHQPFPALVFVTAYDHYAVQAFEAQAVDYLLKPVQPARLQKTVSKLQLALAASAQAAPKTIANEVHDPATGPSTDPALEAALHQLRGLLQAYSGMPTQGMADTEGTADMTGMAGGANIHSTASTGNTNGMAGTDGMDGAKGIKATKGTAPLLQVLPVSAGTHIRMVPMDEVLYFEAADKYVRVLTREREYLLRTALKDLLPQLDPQVFWQVHRGTVVRATAIDSLHRDDAGRLSLHVRGREGDPPLAVSRLYAPRFKAL